MHKQQADRSSLRWKRCPHFPLLSQEFSQVINVSRDVWAPASLPITGCPAPPATALGSET